MVRRMFLPLSVLVPAVEAHLQVILDHRDHGRIEPESTITNLVNHYKYPNPNNPYRRAGTNTSAAVNQKNDRPDSVEMLRALARGDVGNESFGSANIDPASPTIHKRHRLSSAPPGRPPKMAVPELPSPAMLKDERTRFESQYTEMPSSDQTYGNTGQLLGLKTPGLKSPGRKMPGLAYSSEEERYSPFRDPPRSDSDSRDQASRAANPGPSGKDFASSSSYTTLTEKALQGNNLSTLPSGASLKRVSTLADHGSVNGEGDDENDWESAHTDKELEDVLRESFDSYADTSDDDSQRRMSPPRPRRAQPQSGPFTPVSAKPSPLKIASPLGSPETPKATEESALLANPEAWYRQTSLSACQPPRTPLGQRTNVAEAGPSTAPEEGKAKLPAWEDVVDHDEELAMKLLNDKLVNDSILGNIDPKGKKPDRDEQVSDAKKLEALRSRNPSAVRSAVERLVGNVNNFKDQMPTPLASIFPLKENPHQTVMSPSADTSGLLQHAASLANDRPMVFSPTFNSFTTSPDGTILGSPRSPDG